MPLIIIMIFVLYSVAIGWSWNSLEDINKTKKILIIVVELIVLYLITSMVYSISKNDIEYSNANVENNIKMIIVTLFTGFNSLITLPFLNKQIIKLKEKEMSENDIVKKVFIMIFIFIICIIFECGYMKNTQEGIIKVQRSHSQQIESE